MTFYEIASSALPKRDTPFSRCRTSAQLLIDPVPLGESWISERLQFQKRDGHTPGAHATPVLMTWFIIELKAPPWLTITTLYEGSYRFWILVQNPARRSAVPVSRQRTQRKAQYLQCPLVCCAAPDTRFPPEHQSRAPSADHLCKISQTCGARRWLPQSVSK